MTIALNEICHYDDIKWSAAFTFNAVFKNIVDTGIVLKQELLEFRRLEPHEIIKNILMQY